MGDVEEGYEMSPINNDPKPKAGATSSDAPVSAPAKKKKKKRPPTTGQVDHMKEKDYYRCIMTEFLGTLMLVFMITSVVVFSALDSISSSSGSTGLKATVGAMTSSRHLLISFGVGMSYTVLLYGTLGISGGHLNPVITCAMMATKRTPYAIGSLYIVAQLLGAMFGAGLTRVCLPAIPDIYSAVGGAVNTLVSADKHIEEGAAWSVEFMVTFVYTFTQFAASDLVQVKQNYHAGPLAPLAIGLSVMVGHFIAVPVTLCGMNPARSFGPAVMTSNWEYHYIFWLAPLLGGLCGGAVYDMAIADSLEAKLLEDKKE